MPALGTILSTTSVPTTAEFDDHSARHENGGADEISVAGLSGTLADPQTAAAHAASHQDGGADEISIAGLAGTSVDLAAHLADTTAAHAATAIAFTPAGTIAATTVQAAIEEVAAEATGGVTDADYLVGTAHAGLSAEIVVGATPGGELGGTWASPTVDATHSGSTHAAAQAAAEATAAGALSGHTGDTADAHDASAVSVVPFATIAATDVQAALEEIVAEAASHAAVTVGTGLDVTGQLVELDLSEVAAGGELGGFMDAPTVDTTHSGSSHAGVVTAHEAAGDPHTGYRLESADHSHASTGAQGGQIAGSDLSGTPGGELGGTWASPTVDATHSGSTHSAATDTHIADTSDAHDASAISIADAGGDFTATDVEGALDELQADNEAHVAAADPHTGYVREADASWIDLTDGGASTLHSHAGGGGSVTWISVARWGL